MESQSFTSQNQAANGTHSGPTSSIMHSLDSLSALGLDELEMLYASARAGKLGDIAGHPRGRMLAVPGLTASLVFPVIRWFAQSPLMIWEGKSFTSEPGRTEGRGFNRVRLFGRRRAFSFRTLEAPSIVDGKPCLAIAYDVPENGKYAHAVYDELRHLGQGVYLGRGMRKVAGDAPQLLVWFALDTQHQDSDPRS